MTDEDVRERLRRTFHRFATAEAAPQGSPIYEYLCGIVAGDDILLDIAAEASPGQPVPNLFFGAAHALLDEHRDAELAEYYPSLGGTRVLDAEISEAFRSFVIHHEAAIADILRTRLVQTNEVRRSAVLLPAFATVAAESGGSPLALVEVGASAGLNLLVDRYAYRYSGASAGDSGAPLVIETDVRGGTPPTSIPTVASRLGLELNALDVRSAEDMRWLRALVWPEHDERRRMLSAAIAIAAEDPPEVRTADVFADLGPAIEQAPPEAAVVVFATFVLNQFTPEMRERLRTLLLDASEQRDVYVVVVGFSEWFGGERRDFGAAAVVLATLRGGRGSWRQLAVADPHGWWIDWTPQEPQEWAV